MFDQVRADYHRHGRSLLNPALWAMVVYRFGRWSLARRTRAARWVTSKVYGLLFLGVELATGITLNREAIVGEGFHLVHSGNIKVHPGVVIGDRVGLMHDVTLGTNMGRGVSRSSGTTSSSGPARRSWGPSRSGTVRAWRRTRWSSATCRPAPRRSGFPRG